MIVYVVTHKLFDLMLPAVYQKIMVGAALGRDSGPGYILDSTGENISEKNRSYCELTGLYWIWKNSKEDVVGLVHYRRYFAIINKCLRFTGRNFSLVPKEKAYRYLDEHDVIALLDKCDIIVKKSDFKLKNNKSIVYTYLKPSIWDEMEQGVKEFEPDYFNELLKLGKAHTHINCNMFIGKKNIIDKYCEWLFPLLDSIDKRHAERYGNVFCEREMGYMSEFLFGLWLEHNKINYEICDALNTGDGGEVGSIMDISELPSFVFRKLKG